MNWDPLGRVRKPRGRPSTAPDSLVRVPKRVLASSLRARLRPLLADQGGAVAFEMMIVYLFMVTSLMLPLSDLATMGYRFVSAWEALRAFGQYVQYNPPPDVTSTSAWASSLQKTFGGYTISNVQVLCGDTSASAPCASSNSSSPIKYYSFSTTITLTPMVLSSALCTSQNTNPCTFTLPYTERFQ